MALTFPSLAQPGNPSTREWEVAGEVVVIPHSLEVGRELRERIRQEQFTVLGFAPISGLMIVAIEPGLEASAIEYFRSVPGVRFAERSYRGELGSCPPLTPPTSDPDFEDQWHLQNTEQVITGYVFGTNATVTGICGVDVSAVRAWQRTRGSPNIWLAIFDTGIDKDESGVVNSEFSGRLVPSNLELSFSCQQIGPPPFHQASTCCCNGGGCSYGDAADVAGHGTWVTGTAAANHDDSGVMGLDPGCTILPVRVIAEDDGMLARTIIALETVDDLNDENEPYEKVRVINMSYWCVSASSESEQVAYLLAALESLRDEGVFLVTISGNSENAENANPPTNMADNVLPGASPDVICVGGTDNRDRRGAFDNLGGGWSSGRGNALDFVAPGFAILTVGCNNADSTSCEQNCQGGAGPGQITPPLSGTSAAAPLVSATITLLLARAEALSIELDYEDVIDLLKAGAVPLGSGLPNTSYGWGRINAYESLMALERIHYACDADVTHTDNEFDWGFGVPDGKVDSADFYAFLILYCDDRPEADLTTTGYTTAGGGGLNGEPDTVVDSDDFYYFLDFYSNCGTLALCPSCP